MIVVLFRDFCRVSLFGGAAVLLLSLAAVAQENKANDKAAIHGTITDQTQAVVIGATVVLSSDTGVNQDAKTDDKGTYSFTGLVAGTYKLTVFAPKFGQKTMDYIALAAGQELTVDASLEPAGEKTEVNVESGGVGTVETETAASPERSRKKKLCPLDSTAAISRS